MQPQARVPANRKEITEYLPLPDPHTVAAHLNVVVALLVNFYLESEMGIGDSVEGFIGRMLINKKNRDDGLLMKQPQYAGLEPALTVTSPAPLVHGLMTPDYLATASDGGKFPGLEWSAVPPETAEILVVIQDADVPTPSPATHGILYSVPATATSIPSSYFSTGVLTPEAATSGIKLGKTMLGAIYGPPRPLVDHGPHRYFYQVLALRHKLEGLPAKGASYKQVTEQVKKEDILAWGQWVGVAERKLK